MGRCEVWQCYEYTTAAVQQFSRAVERGQRPIAVPTGHRKELVCATKAGRAGGFRQAPGQAPDGAKRGGVPRRGQAPRGQDRSPPISTRLAGQYLAASQDEIRTGIGEFTALGLLDVLAKK